MSEEEDRRVAADITRAAGAGIAAVISAIPGGAPIGAPIGLGIGLVARLIETLGVGEAEARLRELVNNPAPLITQRDLDEQTQDVIAELMDEQL